MQPPTAAATAVVTGSVSGQGMLAPAGGSVTVINSGSPTPATSTGAYELIGYVNVTVNGTTPANTCPVYPAYDCSPRPFQII